MSLWQEYLGLFNFIYSFFFWSNPKLVYSLYKNILGIFPYFKTYAYTWKWKRKIILCHLPNAPDASYYAKGLFTSIYTYTYYFFLGFICWRIVEEISQLYIWSFRVYGLGVYFVSIAIDSEKNYPTQSRMRTSQ